MPPRERCSGKTLDAPWSQCGQHRSPPGTHFKESLSDPWTSTQQLSWEGWNRGPCSLHTRGHSHSHCSTIASQADSTIWKDLEKWTHGDLTSLAPHERLPEILVVPRVFFFNLYFLGRGHIEQPVGN